MENRIDSLFEEVMSLADKIREKENEKKTVSDNLLNITERNIKEIFLPVFYRYGDLVKKLYDRTGMVFSKTKPLGERVKKFIEMNIDYYDTCKEVKLRMYFGGSYGGYCEYATEKEGYTGNGLREPFRDAFKFYTKEGIENLMNDLNIFMAEYLTELIDRCKNKYAELSASVEMLKAELDTSFEVKAKDEESIEIKIGGTTYIGKVVKN